ncbi:MAG: DUF448 domain-containing protein [Candidatus Cloacimonetes bacterium]|nr:DUF448 domain-containing protein [Candidatus Cloacimonadota bacterium]
MPNKNSKAGHQAIRTCVVCKKKSVQTTLMSFFLLDGGVVFDLARKCQTRKHYLCPQQGCVELFPKWLKRQRKKAFLAMGAAQ